MAKTSEPSPPSRWYWDSLFAKGLWFSAAGAGVGVAAGIRIGAGGGRRATVINRGQEASPKQPAEKIAAVEGGADATALQMLRREVIACIQKPPLSYFKTTPLTDAAIVECLHRGMDHIKREEDSLASYLAECMKLVDPSYIVYDVSDAKLLRPLLKQRIRDVMAKKNQPPAGIE